MPRIRLYQPSDLADVYAVCLKTGNSGTDATGRFDNDDLLPDIYAGPYVTLEPELAFMVDVGGRVAGYLVAAADTRAFAEKYRAEWLPAFAERHPLVEPAVTLNDRIVERGHRPESMIGPGLENFPAHLHIDLLPELQGQGYGRLLMRTLIAELRSRGVPGVHLGVGERNLGARAFYARLGFRPLPADPDNELVLGLETTAIV